MTDDEFEAAVDDLMALIDADGCSASISNRTLSIDLHDWQVARLVSVIKGSIDYANNREAYVRRLIGRACLGGDVHVATRSLHSPVSDRAG